MFILNNLFVNVLTNYFQTFKHAKTININIFLAKSVVKYFESIPKKKVCTKIFARMNKHYLLICAFVLQMFCYQKTLALKKLDCTMCLAYLK